MQKSLARITRTEELCSVVHTRFGSLVGSSPPMQEVYRAIERVARGNSSVLLQGETGTGKELVARAIHDASARAKKPFIVVNAAGVPESLLDDELFGHVAGAFTGALHPRVGHIEATKGGTLFLDEIGDMPLSMQTKLLRALEQKEIQRLGDNRVIAVDFRLIAATHRALYELVREGSFRRDLYYRINGTEIGLPPLRERMGDLLLLVAHFIERHTARAEGPPQSEPARPLRKPRILQEAFEPMVEFSWPGNVRELEHFVERLLQFDRPTWTAAFVQRELHEARKRYGEETAASPDSLSKSRTPAATPRKRPIEPSATLERASNSAKRDLLRRTLEETNGNISEAARRLSVTRSWLYVLMRRFAMKNNAKE